jgi:hypothetical protein
VSGVKDGLSIRAGSGSIEESGGDSARLAEASELERGCVLRGGICSS